MEKKCARLLPVTAVGRIGHTIGNFTTLQKAGQGLATPVIKYLAVDIWITWGSTDTNYFLSLVAIYQCLKPCTFHLLRFNIFSSVTCLEPGDFLIEIGCLTSYDRMTAPVSLQRLTGCFFTSLFIRNNEFQFVPLNRLFVFSSVFRFFSKVLSSCKRYG